MIIFNINILSLEYAAISGVIILLRDNLRQEIFDKIISFPISFKIFAADLLFSWYNQNPQLTITCFDEFFSKLSKSFNKPLVSILLFNNCHSILIFSNSVFERIESRLLVETYS